MQEEQRNRSVGYVNEETSPIRARPVALFWELLSQEELKVEEGRDSNEQSFQVVAVGTDILVFESRGRRTLLRHYFADEDCWKTQSLKTKNGGHVSVHAATVSPVNPRVVYILHCSMDWNSDHRYEIYTLDADTHEIEPQIVHDDGIAPKKRHGFSIAPYRFALDTAGLFRQSSYEIDSSGNETEVDYGDHCIYFMCGLQHFPGDATGSFVYCFSPESKTWSQIDYSGSFPSRDSDTPYSGCRFGQSCVVYQDRAWFYGGCVKGAYGMEPTSDLFTFHLVNHEWEKVVTTGHLQPPPLSGHIALVSNGHMFIFTSDGVSIEVYAFDIAASRWELLPEILLGPRPTDGRVFCCISGDRLIAYQQYQDEASQYRRHELFSLKVAEALQALQQTGSQEMHSRNRQELDLLGDEATSDVVFTVEGRKVVAHKKVLQRFCPALSALCEVGEPTRLDNVKYSAFCLMLEHIYSRFTKPLQPVDAEVLLELAQQFELTNLIQRCQDCVVIDASNVRRFLDLAQKAGMEVLNRRCIGHLIAHPEDLSAVSKGPVKNFSGSGSVSPEPPPLTPAPLKWMNPLEAAPIDTRPRPNLNLGAAPIVPKVATPAVVLQHPGPASKPEGVSSYPLDRYILTAPLQKSVAMPPSMPTPGAAPQGQLAGPARHPTHKASPQILQAPQYLYPQYYHMPSRVPPPQ